MSKNNLENKHVNIHVPLPISYFTAHLSNVLKLSPSFHTSEACYVENIKSTKLFLVQTQNPRMYESTNFYFLIKPRKLIPRKKSTFTVSWSIQTLSHPR